MTMLTLTTGRAFIMWLGEQITERGVGNGMSLIIFAGIVVGLPAAVDRSLRQGPHRRLGRLHRAGDDLLIGVMVAGGRFHRVCGTRRAPYSSAVRQARGGPQGDGWAVHPFAAEGECRRRDAGDFRFFDSGVSADRGLWPAQQPLFRRPDTLRWDGASRCTPCCTRWELSSSPTSTSRLSSTPTKLPTTCGSTADLFPAFVPASAPPTTSTRS